MPGRLSGKLSSPFNWTFEEVRKAVVTGIELDGESFVSLDVSRCDAKNERDILGWAKTMGYDAELREQSECIVITRQVIP